jgi:hypothetical protein
MQLSAVLLETVRVAKVEVIRDIDAKAVVLYLPILQLFQAARIRDSTIEISSGWKEVSR